jgi:predicted ATPase
MSKIRIKNFGPIKAGFKEVLKGGKVNEWMDVKKTTVFIGNQGSGKSTVAKLISTMTWLEKAFYRGDESYTEMTVARFVNENCKYHRINNYISSKTEVDYDGDFFTISFRESKLEVTPKKIKGPGAHIPKIMYVPAERNFLSAVEDADDVKGLPKPLYTFAEEYDRSKKELSGQLELPLSGLSFRYDRHSNKAEILGKGYEVNLLEASSGFQSLVPLYVVSLNLANSIQRPADNSKVGVSVKQSRRRDEEILQVEENMQLSRTEKDERIEIINAKYRNTCFVNIVEEPEQNLFPSSQKQVLESLLELNNMNDGNKLIMTTHSPYIINCLTLAVEANVLKGRINTEAMRAKLEEIMPLKATINGDDLVVFELEEIDGTIHLLEKYKGLPSDENKLNEELGEGNELFARLLEMEQKL